MKDLTHLDAQGHARMVDVSGKPVTSRRAVASGWVRMAPASLDALLEGNLPKGDALAVGRIAGIQAAKATSQLIPLCHPLPLDEVRVDLQGDRDGGGVRITVEARTRAATGVEMEALTAVSVAALAVVDMVKAIDRDTRIDDVRLELKEGGKSGRWVREGFADPFGAADA